MSNDPWNKSPTRASWSDLVEKEEAQNGGQLDTSAYPVLSQASKTKGKKKSGQSMSLGQFMTQQSETNGVLRTPATGGLRPQTDTEILLSLPKQPKQRNANDEAPQQWGTKRGGGFTRDDRGRRNTNFRDDEFMPSRADESRDWGTDKRSTISSSNSNNSNATSFQSQSNSRTFERRQNYTFHSSNSGGGGGGGGFSNRWNDDRRTQSFRTASERKPLIIDKRTKPLELHQDSAEAIQVKPKSNPFGQARPREEVLRDRGVDLASSEVLSVRSDVCSEQDVKSQSSTTSGLENLDSMVSRKMKQKSEDPFGGARPREVVLNERSGQQIDQDSKVVEFDRQNHCQVEEMTHRIEAM
eukprot:g60.t1